VRPGRRMRCKQQMRRGLGGLDRLVALARRVLVRPPREVPAWLDLRGTEKVRANIRTARLVEVTDGSGLRRPGYAEDRTPPAPTAFERDLPDRARVVDRGSVVITDQRVAFGGAYYRQDWHFSRMLGLAHEVEAPCTLMRVTDRSKVSGLVVDASVAPAFRVNLTRAIADATGGVRAPVSGFEDGRLRRGQRPRSAPSHKRTTRPPQSAPPRPRHRRSPVEA
jgi:hypothetical protein